MQNETVAGSRGNGQKSTVSGREWEGKFCPAEVSTGHLNCIFLSYPENPNVTETFIGTKVLFCWLLALKLSALSGDIFDSVILMRLLRVYVRSRQRK